MKRILLLFTLALSVCLVTGGAHAQPNYGFNFPVAPASLAGDPSQAKNGEYYVDTPLNGWMARFSYKPTDDGYKRRHMAVDWNRKGRQDLGDPIYSIGNGGSVVWVRDFNTYDSKGWGKIAIIRYPSPLGTPIDMLIAHMDKMFVYVGMPVTKCQVLGTIGDANGYIKYTPHLHLEFRATPDIPCTGSMDCVPRNPWMDPSNSANPIKNYINPLWLLSQYSNPEPECPSVSVLMGTGAVRIRGNASTTMEAVGSAPEGSIYPYYDTMQGDGIICDCWHRIDPLGHVNTTARVQSAYICGGLKGESWTSKSCSSARPTQVDTIFDPKKLGDIVLASGKIEIIPPPPPPDPVPPTPAAVLATGDTRNPTKTSIEISALVHATYPLAVYFEWGEYGNLDRVTGSAQTAPAGMQVSHGATLANLFCDRWYSYRACGEGNGCGSTHTFVIQPCGPEGVILPQPSPYTAFELRKDGPFCTTEKMVYMDLIWLSAPYADVYDIRKDGQDLWMNFTQKTDGTHRFRVTLSPGREYAFDVRARNTSGGTHSNTLQISTHNLFCTTPSPVALSPPDGIPATAFLPPPPPLPPPPQPDLTGFRLAVGTPICDGAAVSLPLSWTEANGATSYDVVQGGSTRIDLVTGITGLSYLLSAPAWLMPGSQFSLNIRARNISGGGHTLDVAVSIPSALCDTPSATATAPSPKPPPSGDFKLWVVKGPYPDASNNNLPAVELAWDPVESGPYRIELQKKNCTDKEEGAGYSDNYTNPTALKGPNYNTSYRFVVVPKNGASTRKSNAVVVHIPREDWTPTNGCL